MISSFKDIEREARRVFGEQDRQINIFNLTYSNRKKENLLFHLRFGQKVEYVQPNFRISRDGQLGFKVTQGSK